MNNDIVNLMIMLVILNQPQIGCDAHGLSKLLQSCHFPFVTEFNYPTG